MLKRSLKTSDDRRTKAAELTLRASIWPICLVTVLFFLWGFSYGLLDTLNKHFQNTLHITRARSSGLQAAYFGFVTSPKFVLYLTELKRVSIGFPWPCQLDPQTLWLQALLHLGIVAVWNRCSHRMAMRTAPLFRWLLCSHLHHR